MRAFDICEQNRLPYVTLTESGGADLPRQSEIFLPGGASFRRLTQLSAQGIPTISLVFGNSTAGGAYTPAMCDYTVFVKDRAKVFLGGPPLVKMATGEESNDEELGGAEMHSRVSGLSDYLAVDELDAIRIGREIIANLNWKKLGPAPAADGGRAAVRGRRPAGPGAGRSEDSCRRPRGDRADRRWLAVSRVQAGLRREPDHGLGVALRLRDRHPGQPAGSAVLGRVAEGGAVHPIGQPPRRAACCSSRTSPATWSASNTNRPASSSTGR